MTRLRIGLAGLAGTVLFASGALTAASYSGYSDVSPDHWAAAFIDQAGRAGVMTGYGDGRFDPEGQVTRAQLAAVSSRLLSTVNALNRRIELLEGMLTGEIPEGGMPEARDAQRRSDVNTILNAVYQYAIDHNGAYPAGITASKREICKSDIEDCGALVDLSVLTEDAVYLVRIPSDPLSSPDHRGTGYRISQDATGRITVEAVIAETASAISVTR